MEDLLSQRKAKAEQITYEVQEQFIWFESDRKIGKRSMLIDKKRSEMDISWGPALEFDSVSVGRMKLLIDLPAKYYCRVGICTLG